MSGNSIKTLHEKIVLLQKLFIIIEKQLQSLMGTV